MVIFFFGHFLHDIGVETGFPREEIRSITVSVTAVSVTAIFVSVSVSETPVMEDCNVHK